MIYPPKYLFLFITCISFYPISSSSEDMQINQLLSDIPNTSSDGSWPYNIAYGRYDSLRRSRPAKLIYGQWSSNLFGACNKLNGVTSIEDEDSWQDPVNAHHCDDGEMALEIHLAGSSPPSENCIDYVSVQFEESCGAGSKANKLYLENKHGERDIMVTLRRRLSDKPWRTVQRKAEAGSRRQHGCAADALISACRFFNQWGQSR